jgi:hypothetical protein
MGTWLGRVDAEPFFVSKAFSIMGMGMPRSYHEDVPELGMHRFQ